MLRLADESTVPLAGSPRGLSRSLMASPSTSSRRARVYGSALAATALLAAAAWHVHGEQYKASRTASPSSAIGEAAQPQGHRIKSKAHGLCLDWHSMLIHSTVCKEHKESQEWHITPGKLSHIETMKNQCLDDGGAHVHIWDCAKNNAKQLWKFNQKSGHIHTGTGSFMDVCLRANKKHGIVDSAKCDRSDKYQKWEFYLPGQKKTTTKKPKTTEKPMVVKDIPAIKGATIKHALGNCLDVGGQQTHLWKCDPTNPHQEYTFDPATGSIKAASGECLDASTKKFKMPCDKDEKSQRWSLDGAKGEIRSGDAEVSSRWCLRTLHAKKTSTLTLKDCAIEDGMETWAVAPLIATAPIKPEVLTSRLIHWGGNCLDSSTKKLRLWQCTDVIGQQWIFDAGEEETNKGIIRTPAGECLDAEASGFYSSCEVGLGSQQWSLDVESGEIRSESVFKKPQWCLRALDARNSEVVTLRDCTVRNTTNSWNLGLLLDPSPGAPTRAGYIFFCLGVPPLLVLLFLSPVLISMLFKQKPAKPPPAKPELIFKPTTDAILFADPRKSSHAQRDVPVVAFSHSCKVEPCDDLCQAAFMGNCYDMGKGGLSLKTTEGEGDFKNAEAAFQATQFWTKSADFAVLDGVAAMKKKQELLGEESGGYAGFGDKWSAMSAVLQAKFKSGTPYGKALEATGDSFLLFHASSKGPLAAGDNPDYPFIESGVWSDDYEGAGSNWLGLQLMLLRDRRTGWKRWTNFIEQSIDVSTGEKKEDYEGTTWQDAVTQAAQAIVEKLEGPKNGGEDEKGSEAPLLTDRDGQD